MAGNIREFGDAAKAAIENEEDQNEEQSVTVSVLGREIVIEYPGTGSLAYLASQIGIVQGDLQAAGVLINFLMAQVSDADGNFLRAKLLDRKSGFDADDVAEICDFLMEAWADGNPTSEPSDSSRRPRTTGANSTGAQRRSQSSRSASRGGAS